MEGYIRGSETSELLATKCSMFKMENISIQQSDWVDDPNDTYADYPYKAEIACDGLTSDHYGNVIFDETLKAVCGYTAQTAQDKLIIWASEPRAGVISSFVVWSNYVITPEGNQVINVKNGLDATTVGMALDATQGKILNDKIKSTNLIFSNKVVSTSTWTEDNTYSEYPYRATIECIGVDANYFPDICFGVSEALSGVFAPICETIVDGVYVYATSIPTADITIPSIRCTRMAE